jgi:positive regulator of sigma E activity
LRESGKVIKEDGRKKTVTVEFERKSACEKCGMCMMSKNNMTVSLTLKNNVDAQLGDIVEVSMGDGFVLTSAAIV